MGLETTKQESQSSVKLMKGMTGKYGWEIKLYFDNDQDFPLSKLNDINKLLNEKYGN